MYYASHTEDFVKSFYEGIGITEPSQLDFQVIADKLDIKVFYWHEPSQVMFLRDYTYIFLKRDLSPCQKWQDFCHELAHALLHIGNQKRLPQMFIQYQEYKANNFMYHACVPTFMLEKLHIRDYTPQTVRYIAHTFNVEYDFALKRLTHYIDKKRTMPNWNMYVADSVIHNY